MTMKHKNSIRCTKCKTAIGFMPTGYTIDIDILCIECNGGKKRKKSKTKRTASGNYSKVKGGVRPDIHPTLYFRSPTEANIARLLNHLNIQWKFEERSFSFHGYKTKPFVYIMDFEVTKIDNRKTLPDGFSPGFIEVKGWMNPASRQKLRRLKKQFPDEASKTTVIIYDKYRKKDIEFCKKLGYKYNFYDVLTKEYKDKVEGWE